MSVSINKAIDIVKKILYGRNIRFIVDFDDFYLFNLTQPDHDPGNMVTDLIQVDKHSGQTSRANLYKIARDILIPQEMTFSQYMDKHLIYIDRNILPER